VDRLQGVDELVCRQRLGQVAAGAFVERRGDQLGLEVPGVDDDAMLTGMLYEHPDLAEVGFRLGEAVVEDDVDVVGYWLVGVDLGDDDPIAVLVEEVGETDEDDVVVVDQRDAQRSRHVRPRYDT
jgi:hypothetical protein